MTDLSLVLTVLDTPDWIFVRPHREIYLQDEVHDAARDRIVARRLPGDTPYAGWHRQQHAFARNGRLEGFQPVYWGGDQKAVRRHLEALIPHGFLVTGGGLAQEAFVLSHDARPTAAVPAAAE